MHAYTQPEKVKRSHVTAPLSLSLTLQTSTQSVLELQAFHSSPQQQRVECCQQQTRWTNTVHSLLSEFHQQLTWSMQCQASQDLPRHTMPYYAILCHTPVSGAYYQLLEDNNNRRLSVFPFLHNLPEFRMTQLMAVCAHTVS